MKTLTTIGNGDLTTYLVQTLEDFEEAFIREIGDGATPDNVAIHGGYMMVENDGVRIVYRKDGIFPISDIIV